jgi:hypothetical protein
MANRPYFAQRYYFTNEYRYEEDKSLPVNPFRYVSAVDGVGQDAYNMDHPYFDGFMQWMEAQKRY